MKVPVFASKFTMAILLDRLKDEDLVIEEKQFVTVTNRTVIPFSDVEVRFFEVPHNIPESLGISIKT